MLGVHVDTAQEVELGIMPDLLKCMDFKQGSLHGLHLLINLEEVNNEVVALSWRIIPMLAYILVPFLLDEK